jgi:hypothetical protein
MKAGLKDEISRALRSNVRSGGGQGPMRGLQSFSCTNQISEEEIWDDDGTLQPSGLTVTTLVAVLLSRGGYSCTEPEADHEHHAWCFEANRDESYFYVQISDIDESELIVFAQKMTGCLWPFGGRDEARALLEYLMQQMRQDPRFGEFRWDD